MAGIATSCLTLSFRSKFQTPWLEFGTQRARNIPGKPTCCRKFGVKAQVSYYVNAEEAKKLVTAEGYAVLDVSTAAANKLEQAGFQNITCITSGLQSVKPDTFDSEVSTELQHSGKAVLVTIQGKISAVLGTVLICAYLFITFFPDQAEKLLQLASSS